jgi:uncharacterized protein
MGQTWEALLFAHWRLPPAALAGLIPPMLALDTFGGDAWLGITPFRVRGLHLRATPPLPWLSHFPELNVRTYVVVGDRPGIWFFSLDAARRAGVVAARLTYRLPYFQARMCIRRAGSWVDYTSSRRDRHGAPARFRARYRPVGTPAPAAPGTLDAWLVERYRLYTVDGDGEIHAADIHHAPWPLQSARAEISENTLAEAAGVSLSGEPVVHFAHRQDVLVWPGVRASEAS